MVQACILLAFARHGRSNLGETLRGISYVVTNVTWIPSSSRAISGEYLFLFGGIRHHVYLSCFLSGNDISLILGEEVATSSRAEISALCHSAMSLWTLYAANWQQMSLLIYKGEYIPQKKHPGSSEPGFLYLFIKIILK